MGHRDELLRRKASIQSGWKIWRQGSSRTCVSPCSNSSKKIGQVSCDQEADAVVLAGTVDDEDVGGGRECDALGLELAPASGEESSV